MKFEQTVQYYFDKMPQVFQTREQVLEHLFVVIGNGYDWINGQLVDKDNSIDEKEIILKGGNKAKQVIKDDGMKNLFEILDKDINSIEYPLYDCSKLFTYPDDIEKDWLEGIKETVILLLQREVSTEGYNDYMNKMNDKTKGMLNQLANRLGIV